MVTSHDVARLAGVSQPTVSRALRDSPRLSPATKQRVRQAARDLGYVPSESGRALSSGRTRRVGLLLTDLKNQFYPHIIAPMHQELSSLGYHLMLQTESADNDAVAERLIATEVDGVLLATTTLDSVVPIRLRDRGVPFVYVNRTAIGTEADSATVDPVPGFRELARVIADFRHRRIAAIFGPANTSTGIQREAALRDALAEHGLGVAGEDTYRGRFDAETGRAGARELLGRSPRPSVVVCANDVVALGALNAAVELGVAVPEEVSIVGFDDLPIAGWPLIRLTTIAYDIDALARRAAVLLAQRIEQPQTAQFRRAPYRPPAEHETTEGQQVLYEHAVFGTRLVSRSSLAAAP